MLRKLADEAELPQTLASRLMPAALAGSLGLIYGATQAPGDSILRGALIGGLGGAGAGLGFSAGNAFMESDAAKNMRSPGIGAGMALGGGALGLRGGLLAGRAISKRTGLGDEDDRTSDDLKEMDLMRNAKHLPAGLSDYVKRSNAPAPGPGLMNQLASILGYAPKAQAAPSPIVQQQPAPTPPKPGGLSSMGTLGYAGLGGGALGYAAHRDLPSTNNIMTGLRNVNSRVKDLHLSTEVPQVQKALMYLMKNRGGVRNTAVGLAGTAGALGLAGLGNYLYSGQPKQASDSINRQLDPDELAQIAKGKQQILGDMFPTEFDPIPKQMRSPTAAGARVGAVTGVPTGLAAGIMGALLSNPSGRSPKGALLAALAGSLGVGGAIGGGAGALAYHSQDARNRELEGWMKRLPKGSAMRDTVYDPAAQQRQLFEHQRQTFSQRPAK